jgi:hypothetical protein
MEFFVEIFFDWAKYFVWGGVGAPMKQGGVNNTL